MVVVEQDTLVLYCVMYGLKADAHDPYVWVVPERTARTYVSCASVFNGYISSLDVATV